YIFMDEIILYLFFVYREGSYLLKKIFNRNNNNTVIPDEQSKKEIPEGLMTKCDKCGNIAYRKELINNEYVCLNCDHHMPLDAWTRIGTLFDEGSFEEWDTHIRTNNPLGFPEYLEKLEKDSKKTGLTEAVVTGKGTIQGNETAFAVMDAGFRMGSMGSVVGEKITRAIERARELKIPFIIFTASGGARMQEGVLSLMQMSKTSFAIKRFSD